MCDNDGKNLFLRKEEDKKVVFYDVVKEKRWTLDYQAQIVNNMYDDIDSIPGESEDDFYGFLTNSQIFVDPYVASCDLKLLVKDADSNFFKFEPEKEKLDTVGTENTDIGINSLPEAVHNHGKDIRGAHIL